MARGHSDSTSSYNDFHPDHIANPCPVQDERNERRDSASLLGQTAGIERGHIRIPELDSTPVSPARCPGGPTQIDAIPRLAESASHARKGARDSHSDDLTSPARTYHDFDSRPPPAYGQGVPSREDNLEQFSEEEQIQRALQLSLKSEAERQIQLEQSAREEQTVMEYIRKASLAEAEMKEKANR